MTSPLLQPAAAQTEDEPTLADLAKRVRAIEDIMGGLGRLVDQAFGGLLSDDAMREVAGLPAVESEDMAEAT